MSVVWEMFEKSGFFSDMRRKLEKSELKNRENNLTEIELESLVHHLRLEIEELLEALKFFEPDSIIKDECVDVANMCAFVYVYSKLSEAPT